MDPVNPTAGNPEAFNQTPPTPDLSSGEVKPEVKKDNHWITILAMALFVLLAFSAVAFLYYQNQQLKSMLTSYQPTPTASVAPTSSPTQTGQPSGSATPSATSKPIVTSPKPGSKVSSPLTVTGTVPANWMFEGVFPIKLVDSSKKLIVQGQAKEKIPGSWQTGKTVEFTATLTFTTTANSGFIILMNDNPSGDPAKSETFEVPVTF